MTSRFFLRLALGLILVQTPLAFADGLKALTSKKQIKEYDPIQFLDSRLSEITQSIDSKEIKANPNHLNEPLPSASPSEPLIQLSPRPVRNSWLESLYEKDLIEASELTRLLVDKLLMAEVIRHYLGESGEKWHPKTMGLKYFLKANQLVNSRGQLIASREQILKSLNEEFPNGSILKPASGMNSQGKTPGFYFNMQDLAQDLIDKKAFLYSPKQFKEPFVSPLIDRVASGEKFILQENVISAAGVLKPLKVKEFKEVRVHSYAEHAVTGATYSRWKELKNITDEELQKATQFIDEFLKSLPQKLTHRQAFSYDVAILDNGVLRIIEINTNRGRAHHWSGYLSSPWVLGAYTRHFEKHYPIKFEDLGGFLFRHDLANYTKYLKKKYIEGTL